MKKMQKCLLLCALLMVICATVKPAMSYFTTFVTAKGGYIVHMQETSEIQETVKGLEKSIVIQNTDPKVPVYVRAKAIASDEYKPTAEAGEGWTLEQADGWFYYTKMLNPGEKTPDGDPLVFKVTTPKMVVNDKESVEINDINVVVVYESAPVLYDDKGEALAYDAKAIWDQPLKTYEQEGGIE